MPRLQAATPCVSAPYGPDCAEHLRTRRRTLVTLRWLLLEQRTCLPSYQDGTKSTSSMQLSQTWQRAPLSEKRNCHRSHNPSDDAVSFLHSDLFPLQVKCSVECRRIFPRNCAESDSDMRLMLRWVLRPTKIAEVNSKIHVVLPAPLALLKIQKRNRVLIDLVPRPGAAPKPDRREHAVNHILKVLRIHGCFGL